MTQEDESPRRTVLLANALLALSMMYGLMLVAGVVLLFAYGSPLAGTILVGSGLVWGGVYLALSHSVRAGACLGLSVGILVFKLTSYGLAEAYVLLRGTEPLFGGLVVALPLLATASALMVGIWACRAARRDLAY